MSAVAEHRSTLVEQLAAGRSGQRLFEPAGVTLEDLVLEAWEDLEGRGSAECPVCGGRLDVARGCEGCGSELS